MKNVIFTCPIEREDEFEIEISTDMSNEVSPIWVPIQENQTPAKEEV